MTEKNATSPEVTGPQNNTPQETIPRCLFCGQPESLIWVHGHGQCAHCGVNAMPCCDGAECVVPPK